MLKTRVFPNENYKGIWVNGKTIRIALDSSKPIEELKYPEFYDVKITNHCHGKCPYCYMDSQDKYDHAVDIIGKTKKYFGSMTKNERPFQVAIGGGEPTSHPDFVGLLAEFDKIGITPNYTTNGMFVDFEMKRIMDLIDSTKKYCGGVAVSCHEHLDKYWRGAAMMFSRNNIKLNFHIIISDAQSSDRFREIYDEWQDVVDYFVLLPYGVQGRAEQKEINWEHLVSVLPDDTTKVAFGANFYPYLLTNKVKKINVSLYEPEIMSKFLDYKDMKLYPSSFNLVEVN